MLLQWNNVAASGELGGPQGFLDKKLLSGPFRACLWQSAEAACLPPTSGPEALLA